MASGGNRVLLLDADMRRPRTQRVFNASNQIGLSSVVAGAGKVEDAIKSTEIPGLFLLVCGPIPPNPTELLHTQAFMNLLRELEEQYDRIVIDSPPVGVVADAAVLSTQVDGTLLVLRAGTTSRDGGLRAVRALRNVKARIFGAVLNDLDLESRRYGYDYEQYGYYYTRKKDEAVS
jgi:capsular exopolysaccharide synthesis family protein